MKKWMIALVIVLVVISPVYLFIPYRIILKKTIDINVPLAVASRYLADQNKWPLWWSSKELIQDGYSYSVKDIIFNTVVTSIQKNGAVVNSHINLRSLIIDSVTVEWEYNEKASLNPVKRLIQYKDAIRINNNSAILLQAFSNFIQKKENIYGCYIWQESTIDTILIATKKTFAEMPSTTDVYNLIRSLQDYAKLRKAKQTGSPMLNISRSDSAGIQVMVAVPTDKILADYDKINFKRMFPGNFLVAEVKGGDATVKKNLERLQLYTEDHQRKVMAIPFEVLVTDRMKERDTSKWITKLYMPVE